MITRRQTLKGGLALGAVASGAFRGAGAADADVSPLTLWYRQPAELWTEALPIGNGRLGAMIFGGVARERLQLNEDTLYAGGPYDPSNPEALAALPRESFASAVDQVIVTHITADRPGALDFQASFETPMPGAVAIEDGHLVLNGRNISQEGIEARLRFQARVAVIPQGGTMQLRDGEIVVSGADSALVLVAIATSFRRFDDVSGDPEAITRAQIEAAAAKTLEALHEAHVADHQKLFRRVSFELPPTPASDEPTNLRIRNSQTSDDPQLAALYFQYARYLLIGCSRPGTQPANLQGLWNDKLLAPWGSKYTININTEMNYWPAEPANLSECVQPLVAMVKDLAITGAVTARVNYGAGGWVAHHNTDLWRATGPIDGAFWGMWPTGGAWLCKHLWDHYDYGRDRAYLADVYPLLKGAAQFFLDTLVQDPSGKLLVTSPSISPENRHPHGSSICAGPAMDNQILRDLFANTIRAAEILGLDTDFRKACAATRGRLPPDRIGKGGQLQEWMEDWDLEAPERDHRHVSHLYALFPSEQITVRRTPALAAAVRKSLELRGDLSTGWAIAWRINLWARLRDAEHTHGVIKLLLDPSRTYPNMFDAHPPFQIDGNFGGANGMMEMLLQCVDGEIELLPALPRAWATGSIRGLRARGGFEVAIAWRDGELQSAELRGAPGGVAQVRYRDKLKKIRVAEGRRVSLKPAEFR